MSPAYYVSKAAKLVIMVCMIIIF